MTEKLKERIKKKFLQNASRRKPIRLIKTLEYTMQINSLNHLM